jgi:hypothetical protein
MFVTTIAIAAVLTLSVLVYSSLSADESSTRVKSRSGRR